ncbi:MAG: hypothetical protein GX786_10820 [Clostridiales bacterium]|nr:hypothetical protein [Clostridiales bacterium]
MAKIKSRKDLTFYEKQLSTLYQDLDKDLYHLLMTEIELGRNFTDTQGMIKEINKVLRKYGVKLNKWAEEATGDLFLQGAVVAYKQIKGRDASLPDIALMKKHHTKAIKLVTKNLKRTFDDSLAMIGRQKKDVYRELGLISTAKKYAHNMTYSEQSNYFKHMASELGYSRIPFVKNPKMSMRVDPYAKLIARTTTAEISNQARIDEGIRLENYLVSMSEHHTPCKECAKVEGRVFRVVNEDELPKDMTAEDKVNILAFPHIREACKDWPTYKTVHPNCRHRFNIYVLELKLDETIAEDKKRSNRPFVDERSQAQIDEYDKSQEENRKRWRDRREWEKYKESGMDVPSFSGFRQMKKHNSVNYKQLKAGFHGLVDLIE